MSPVFTVLLSVPSTISLLSPIFVNLPIPFILRLLCFTHSPFFIHTTNHNERTNELMPTKSHYAKKTAFLLSFICRLSVRLLSGNVVHFAISLCVTSAFYAPVSVS